MKLNVAGLTATQILNHVFDILKAADVTTENDGIGSYECHGAVGYDKGTNYLVFEGDDEILLENLTEAQSEELEDVRATIEDDNSAECELEAALEGEGTDTFYKITQTNVS